MLCINVKVSQISTGLGGDTDGLFARRLPACQHDERPPSEQQRVERDEREADRETPRGDGTGWGQSGTQLLHRQTGRDLNLQHHLEKSVCTVRTTPGLLLE